MRVIQVTTAQDGCLNLLERHDKLYVYKSAVYVQLLVQLRRIL